MANLAIKGHPSRSEEVIQLLEMLGADRLGYKDTFVGFYYYIECDVIVSSDECPIDAIVFTLEEFEKKFPYKVGDKVNSPCKGCIKTITSMWWDTYLNTITYKLDHRIYTNIDQLKVVNDLQPYKEEGVNLQELERKLDEALAKETTESLNKWLDEENMDTNNLCTQCVYAVDNHCGLRGFTNDFNRLYCSAQNADKLPNGFELQPDGYFSWVDSKPQYPKIYIECCECLKYNPFINNVSGYKRDAIGALQTLITCRDAYWEIAGEQMGLGKPWEPYDAKDRYIIRRVEDEIRKGYNISCVLEFPTAEMRDAFFENFKGLIEQCKELL